MYTTAIFYGALVLSGIALHRRFPNVKSLNEVADAVITLIEVPARLVHARLTTPAKPPVQIAPATKHVA